MSFLNPTSIHKFFLGAFFGAFLGDIASIVRNSLFIAYLVALGLYYYAQWLIAVRAHLGELFTIAYIV
jgi:hypothetical protein